MKESGKDVYKRQDAATAIASGIGSLFGSGKLKELEQVNEKLRQEAVSYTHLCCCSVICL